ncbi:hypothetical protein MASR1M31_13930 [Porphyromonadaceae bacterium]
MVDGFEYVFARYEKLGIIGNNGTGKSTFIKMLTGQVAPDAGEIEIGETVRSATTVRMGCDLMNR